MLKGAKTEFKGMPAFLAVADISSEHMEESIAAIAHEAKFFKSISVVSAFDIIKNPEEFKGLKRPMTAFIFTNDTDLDLFVDEYEKREMLKSYIKNELDWEQDKMHTEDQLRADMIADEISSMEEIISGKRSDNQTIGALYGIDKEDKWDTRSEKQKAEDLLNSASMMQKLIEEGMFTDEAMAPAHEQHIEAEKLPLIDKDNIPEFLMEKFKEDGLDEIDIENAIDDMNRQIEEQNKRIEEGLDDDEDERTKRIVGGILNEDGSTGGIFINRDKLPGGEKSKSSEDNAQTSTKKSSILDQMKNSNMNNDDIRDILKPSSIDGKHISDFKKYVFDNTSLDAYDYKDFISELDETKLTSSSVNVSDLPKNIGNNSDINYEDSTVNQYDGTASRLDEDEDIYLIKLDKSLTNDNIIGTKNINMYSVSENVFTFIPNVKTEKYIMLVTSIDDKITIYKFKF